MMAWQEKNQKQVTVILKIHKIHSLSMKMVTYFHLLFAPEHARDEEYPESS
mgnify:CR=1 FL=1